MVSVLNSAQKKEFDQKGFILIRNFFDKEETSLLQQASYKDKNIKKHLYDRKDAEGLENKYDIHNRSKRSITADLKNKESVVLILFSPLKVYCRFIFLIMPFFCPFFFTNG